jgi:hypothetical protein
MICRTQERGDPQDYRGFSHFRILIR